MVYGIGSVTRLNSINAGLKFGIVRRFEGQNFGIRVRISVFAHDLLNVFETGEIF